MNRPQMKVSEPYWDYLEVIKYLNYMNEEFNERKVWHSIIDTHNISNGSYFWFDVKQDDYDNEHIAEFKLLLQKYFPEVDCFKFWVEW